MRRRRTGRKEGKRKRGRWGRVDRKSLERVMGGGREGEDEEGKESGKDR